MLRTRAFESFDFSNYDVVISSSSAEAKGIITPTETLHVSYVHTPTRYYWSGYEDYLRSPGLGVVNPFAKLALPRVVKKMRYWDFAAAQRPDILVANSKTVQDRITKYYKRDSVVIHPPVNTVRFESTKKTENGDYYLVVGRLIPYKRVDLAVQACTKLNKKLIVIGNGSELKRLKSLAGPSITFAGELSDKEVTKHYLNCKAFIFTAFEDFGITPVEAMSAGKPVICYGHGGVSESVQDGITGVFFNRQTVENVAHAIESFETSKFSSDVIKKRAQEFSTTTFNQQIENLIQHNVDVEL